MHSDDDIRGWLASLPTGADLGDDMGDARGSAEESRRWSALRGKKIREANKNGFGGRSKSPDTIRKAAGQPSGLTTAQINYIRGL